MALLDQIEQSSPEFCLLFYAWHFTSPCNAIIHRKKNQQYARCRFLVHLAQTTSQASITQEVVLLGWHMAHRPWREEERETKSQTVSLFLKMQTGTLGHHCCLFGLLFNSDISISICFIWLRAAVDAAVGGLKISFSNSLGVALGSLSEKQRTGKLRAAKQRKSWELRKTSTWVPYISDGSSTEAYGFRRRENCVKFQKSLGICKLSLFKLSLVLHSLHIRVLFETFIHSTARSKQSSVFHRWKRAGDKGVGESCSLASKGSLAPSSHLNPSICSTHTGS